MSGPQDRRLSGGERTTVHLLRHGEVYNPDGILYGRADGYHLSGLGRRMADRVADRIGHRDITVVVSSPLERAQETAAPLARVRGLEVRTDERVIESDSVFAGQRFGVRRSILRSPEVWKHLWNPFRPSWGEPYREIADRMLDAIVDVRDQARGHEGVIVSHQLPIWTTRLAAEKRSFMHDPRKRHCTLASLTSFTYDGDRLVQIGYSEPAGDLIPVGDRGKVFSAGGKDEQPPQQPPRPQQPGGAS